MSFENRASISFDQMINVHAVRVKLLWPKRQKACVALLSNEKGDGGNAKWLAPNFDRKTREWASEEEPPSTLVQ